MKIDDILSGQNIQESKSSSTPKTADGGSDAFAMLLQNEIVGQGQPAAPDDAVSGPAGLTSLLGVQALISNSDQTPEVSTAMSAIDDVLTQLDSLGGALQQGNKTPKEIDALIQGINSQAAGIDDKISGLPADHKLRDMAEEVKVTAYMESTKWNRGDYM
jgi:hypothetical protein